MSETCNILGIAGSLRRESYNHSAMRAATELVPVGAKIDVFDLDGIPGFNQDDEQHPPAKVVDFKRRIRAADALLFVTAGIQLLDPRRPEERHPPGRTATTRGMASPRRSWTRRSAELGRRGRSISSRWSSSMRRTSK